MASTFRSEAFLRAPPPARVTSARGSRIESAREACYCDAVRWTHVLFGCVCAAALRGRIENPASQIRYRDISNECGIRFRHAGGSAEKRYIFETMSGGDVLFDYDNDGRIDVDLVNGATLELLSGQARPGPITTATATSISSLRTTSRSTSSTCRNCRREASTASTAESR